MALSFYTRGKREREDDPFVVPDSIEPLLGWRSWNYQNGLLQSLHHGGSWPKQKPAEAGCTKDGVVARRWTWVWKGSARPEEITARAWEKGYRNVDEDYCIPCPPEVVLSHGVYVWAEVKELHEQSPAVRCTCGIYAVEDEAACPEYGQVFGQVKLWGKVIPGEIGWRAQFGYPERLYVGTKRPKESAVSGWYISQRAFGSSQPAKVVSFDEMAEKLAANYNIPVEVI